MDGGPDFNWMEEGSGGKISPEKKICIEEKEYVWRSEFDKIRVVREGVPYGSVEVLSKRMGRPVKVLLEILEWHAYVDQRYLKLTHRHQSQKDSNNTNLFLQIAKFKLFTQKLHCTQRHFEWMSGKGLKGC